ncbi:MAG TPA: MerR family transcriptional regulator [Acidimicrobiales bacterium]|nr:MerR family transcriptional regulator [Acidimicrobiales bacterium]
MIDRKFRSPEAVRLARITYRQLDYWARIGLVRPTEGHGDGCGSIRLYSYRDVFDLFLVARFAHAGMSLQRCRAMIDVLHQAEMEEGEDPYTGTLVIEEGCPPRLVSPRAMTRALRESGAAFVVLLPRLEEIFDERVMEVAPGWLESERSA